MARKSFSGFLPPPKPAEEARPSTLLTHFVAATGEFVGTFLFLFFAFLGHMMSASQASDKGPNGAASAQTVIFISLSYGLSLLVTAWPFYRISGAAFNPAVTLGLVLTGNMPAVRGIIYVPTQLLAGICAAAVAGNIVPGDIAATQTTLADGMSVAQGLFLEMFLTCLLILTILMLACEKGKQTFVAPLGIGMSLFVTQIAGVYYTGASLNPARSFGPCVAAAKFQGYHWIYWVGPALGALIASGYYYFIKMLHYEFANPGQDGADGQFVFEASGDGKEKDLISLLSGGRGSAEQPEDSDRREAYP
ncbi:hypothetical protein AC579_340 [Lecanosticta acicola]|uniref:Aquaporin n=1 Tax=Lecanosticta acicola TaxID=111012 RepID=A0AAI8Z6Y8_9PEZI|nr:hypothetical protein AC579_340 [Lecanosticta acicola]